MVILRTKAIALVLCLLAGVTVQWPPRSYAPSVRYVPNPQIYGLVAGLQSADSGRRQQTAEQIKLYRRQLIGALCQFAHWHSGDYVGEPWKDTKYEAVTLLGELRAPEGVPVLVAQAGYTVEIAGGSLSERFSFGSTHPAARALAQIGEPASPVIVKRLAKLSDSEEATALVWALVQIEGKELARHLIQAEIDQAHSELERANLARALADVGVPPYEGPEPPGSSKEGRPPALRGEEKRHQPVSTADVRDPYVLGLIEGLQSDDVSDRSAASSQIRSDRYDLVQALLQLAGGKKSSRGKGAEKETKELAIELLGDIRAAGAVPVLFGQVDYAACCQSAAAGSRGSFRPGPALTALAKIGKPASTLQALHQTSDPEKARAFVWILDQVEGPDRAKYLISKQQERYTLPPDSENLKRALALVDEMAGQ